MKIIKCETCGTLLCAKCKIPVETIVREYWDTLSDGSIVSDGYIEYYECSQCGDRTE